MYVMFFELWLSPFRIMQAFFSPTVRVRPVLIVIRGGRV
jgi:hypothetical protein